MDDPGVDPQQHVQALQGLARLNAVSGSVGIVWPCIEDAAQRAARPIKLLDIATGAGDVPLGLWQRARRRGIALKIDACDRSPTAIAYAQSRAQQSHAPISFFEFDALSDALPKGYDIVLSSLFLHHLDEDEAISLLRHMGQAAGSLVVVNDLVRSLSGLLLAYVGTRLLTTSSIVHTDGPRSVRAAYSKEEVHQLAREAGLDGAAVRLRWPCRFLLTWNSSSP